MTKEITTHLVKPIAVQEEMCVILIAHATQAQWAEAVKFMKESVFIVRTKLYTKFRQTLGNRRYQRIPYIVLFNSRMVDRILLLNAARDLAFYNIIR